MRDAEMLAEPALACWPAEAAGWQASEAPALSAADSLTCQSKFKSTRDPRYENCLIFAGCQRRDPDMTPFHGAFFPKLPLDFLAWQQPAPFCCSMPRSVEQAQNALQRQFFDMLGGVDPEGIMTNINGNVDDDAQKSEMLGSIKAGLKGVRTLLEKALGRSKDMLLWIVTLVKNAVSKLMSYLVTWSRGMDSDASESDKHIEVTKDGQSLLQLHEDGPIIAPTGSRAIEFARWSHDHQGWVELEDHELQYDEKRIQAKKARRTKVKDSLVEARAKTTQRKAVEPPAGLSKKAEIQAQAQQAYQKGQDELVRVTPGTQKDLVAEIQGFYRRLTVAKSSQIFDDQPWPEGIDNETGKLGGRPVYMRLKHGTDEEKKQQKAAYIFYDAAKRCWRVSDDIEAVSYSKAISTSQRPVDLRWTEGVTVVEATIGQFYSSYLRNWCQLNEDSMSCEDGNDVGNMAAASPSLMACKELCDNKAGGGCKAIVFFAHSRPGVPNCRLKTRCRSFVKKLGAVTYGDCSMRSSGFMAALTKVGRTVTNVVKNVWNYGIAKLWNFVTGPLRRLGMDLAMWVANHPKVFRIFVRLALQLKNQICKRLSEAWLGTDEKVLSYTEDAARMAGEAAGKVGSRITPAAIMQSVFKQNEKIAESAKNLVKQHLGGVFSFIPSGLSSGGAHPAMTDAVMNGMVDSMKNSVVDMVKAEIIGEGSGNIVEALTSPCIYKRTKIVKKGIFSDSQVQYLKSWWPGSSG
eukprot:TRINITY_DN4440_c0_g2_i2.p1 TRINITY_DN4440_c0_g2~~TRINITY_DN4440_c0_g2_i2.p1  ORF type:complete len:744 (+),score=193.66 TRINITY_DN4440_c0_g2_i2:284-2515(+)